MKKLLLAFVFASAGWQATAQTTNTVAIQFYVDGNNNCTYDLGETLVYGVPGTFSWLNTQNNVSTTAIGFSVIACSAQTIYAWSANTTTPVQNTITINPNSGFSPNLACGTMTNFAYNSNTINYLPVIVNTTASIGASVTYINYYTSAPNSPTYSPASGTIGICSNLGNDSLALGMTISNLYGCNSTSMSPRTYSLFMDGVNYDQATRTGAFGSWGTVNGINSLFSMYEYYAASSSMLQFYLQFPPTFSVLGTHTFEIRSSMIYNDPLSVVNYSLVINSIPCNKISGRFYTDCNNNCTYDAGDSYGVSYYAMGQVYNASTGYNVSFYPAPDGKFSLYLPTTTAFSLTQYPSVTNPPNNFTACTTGTTSIPAGAATNTFMFGYQPGPNGTANPGVYVGRINSTSNILSPGVGATMGVYLSNSWWNVCASTPNSGVVKVTLPKFVNYLSMVSGSTPTAITTDPLRDSLIWSVPNFSAFTNAFCSFSVAVNATATPNATFAISAFIYPTTDSYLPNNTYNWIRTIGGPFDPNDKTTEVTGLKANGDVPFGSTQFFYTIRFQNIGNAPAINVKTLDTIDVNFDLATLKVVQSSFPASTQVDNVSRQVGFFFNGINLPGIQNEPASHGFVRYTVNLKPGVPVNTVLKNRAHNYFDFNEGVATNQTSNKLVQVTVTGINEDGTGDNSLRAVPNPFNGQLKISSDKAIGSIRIYNLMGALLSEMPGAASEATLNLEHLPAAMYIIKVSSVEGLESTIKVIKQ